jgi:hypothetical protein
VLFLGIKADDRGSGLLAVGLELAKKVYEQWEAESKP